MDFALNITMDKKEMRHPRNVARALERVAHDLDKKFELGTEPAHAEGIVRDVSGSIVGRWEIRPEAKS
jgi:hypothetical protein